MNTKPKKSHVLTVTVPQTPSAILKVDKKVQLDPRSKLERERLFKQGT